MLWGVRIMQNNSDVNSDVWFSADELAELQLPGYPRSGRRFHDRAKAEGWKSREVPSQGRTGMRVEYSPPLEVMVLIKARRSGELPARQERAPYNVNPIDTGGGVKAATITPDKEWLVRVAMFAANADWLKEVDQERKVRIILEAFRLTLMLSAGDASTFSALTAKPEAMLSALRLAYEIDCIERGVAPGSPL